MLTITAVIIMNTIVIWGFINLVEDGLSYLEDECGGNPCKQCGVDGCEYGPAPFAWFVVYGDACDNAWHVEEYEDEEGNGWEGGESCEGVATV